MPGSAHPKAAPTPHAFGEPPRGSSLRPARRRALAGAILVLWAGIAGAEWKAIGTPAGSTPGPRIAYDTAQVRFEPPHVTTWTRVELPAVAALGDGIRYRSVLQKVVVDCSARTWGVTHSDFFASADATGIPVFSETRRRDEWELNPARAGSPGDQLIRALCTTPRPW
jgi:hypothetical protein